MKKIRINNRLLTVIPKDEYNSNPDLYNPKFTALDCGTNIIYPMKTQNDDKFGICIKPNSMCSRIVEPITDSELEEAQISNVIDYDSAKNMEELLATSKVVKNIENDILLTNQQNILHLNIAESNSPAMKALKTAINLKHIDPESYESNFDQYQNDMRLILKSDDITLKKTISICNAFDIDVSLVLSDKQGDIPNKMHQEIEVSLTNSEKEVIVSGNDDTKGICK